MKKCEESLIGKIETLKSRIYYVDGKPNLAPYTNQINSTVDRAIAIIREHEANMGDAAIGNDAEDAGKTVGSDSQHVHTSPSKCVCAMKHSGECQSSEISDVETISKILRDEFQVCNTEPTYSYHEGAEYLIKQLRPYLRTMEPVSVSLEKCAKVVRATSCIIGNDYCERLCEMNPCACASNYAKAVLDAAGVPYVD